VLGKVAHAHEEDDDGCGGPLPNGQGRQHANGHHRMSNHLAPQRGLDDVAEDRIAKCQDDE